MFVFNELGLGFMMLAGFRPAGKGAINAKIEEENPCEGKKRKKQSSRTNCCLHSNSHWVLPCMKMTSYFSLNGSSLELELRISVKARPV